MDILKRKLAPISAEAWEQIDDQAKKILINNLSARKFVDVVGPMGWDYAVCPTGKVETVKACEGKGICLGVRQVLPLVEPRVEFELCLWELDNITRGLKNPDLSPLEEAARQIACFEEEAIYKGLKEGNIVGLREVTGQRSLKVSMEESSFIGGVADAVSSLKSSGVEGPYVLVAGTKIWKWILSRAEGYPLAKRIEALAEKIIPAPSIDEAYVVSLRGGDMELVLGVDFSLGFVNRSAESVKLFLTESFTFRVVNPEAILRLEV